MIFSWWLRGNQPEPDLSDGCVLSIVLVLLVLLSIIVVMFLRGIGVL